MTPPQSLFDEVPLQKVRPSAVYLNARNYGMDHEAARECADTWNRLFNTCFTQRVAGEFYNVSKVETVDFPADQPKGCLYVTAHFSAYTFVSIALARHYKKKIYLVVGKPPKDFEDYLVNSMAVAGVEAILIRSDFSQLRKIRRAIDAGELVLSLIDVPWHRTVIKNREYEYFVLGAGKIAASRSIYKIAERLDLTPALVLCEPEGDGFNVVYHGEMTQEACFEVLADLISKHPGHFERFCEMHMYYQGGVPCNNLTTFLIGDHRYIAVSNRNKFWKLGTDATLAIEAKLESENGESDASEMIKTLVKRLSEKEYDQVVYF